VLAYDAQLMLGNGPRTGDFLAALANDLTELRTRLGTDTDTNTDTDPNIDKETP
jgi:hypothetical protein